MLDKSLGVKEKEIIIKYLAKSYKISKKRESIYQFQGNLREKDGIYNEDKTVIHLIDSTIEECTRNTQLIIMNEYFKNKEYDWYLGYFSRSSFYRLKRLAIEEFIDCLNI